MKRILIVEDNALNRAILSQILSGEYTALEAENGLQALDVLKENPDISLILLDVMMPVMDGFTFLDTIRNDPELSLIPVIVMTQNNNEEDEVAALAHGATDFVPKPYRPQVILHRVASLIKLRETAAMVNQYQYDRLTGLCSKEYFYQKVRERLDTCPDRNYSIIYSDIENFKLYNDTFGRDAGDRLLKEGAALLQRVMGSESICGRYGADCFLSLCERPEEPRTLYNHFSVPLENSESIYIKWGIFEITDPSIPVEQMCDRALLAANNAKGQYNLPFVVYDDALRDKLVREKTISDAMETALAEEQFIVYLQPKYSLNSSFMAGAEALVRWIHPEWGFMSPGEFIPLFEKNGFIHRLDQYVWEKVCALLRDWKRKGYPLLPISVNVSRADVYKARLVDVLSNLVKTYEIDPAYLHLEITESAYADNPNQIISTVAQLRRLGFPIEMDDFGSGYSSLNMLSQMQLDILKLDMKFVQNEITKPADISILNDVVTMAHRMHLSVVAEGIETKDQAERLQTIGCDYAQGYFFAKPMPVADFEKLLNDISFRVSPDSAALRPETSARKLLVVDESINYAERVRTVFRDRYEVVGTCRTDEALAHIRQNGDVSVLILSVALPDNGAAQLLSVLRQDPLLWRIPVLATVPNGDAMEQFPLAKNTDDFLCKCHPMFDLCRRVDRLVDIMEARRRENSLQDEACRDYLTGLLNRRGMQTAIDSLRKEDLPLALCLFDLDNLKVTNDTSGHKMGDHLLQSFAALLRQQTRTRDILCRYGGDEFIVVLKNLRNEEDALRKGQYICDAFHNYLTLCDTPGSCSVGIAMCSAYEKPSSMLIERADKAMYRAKRENKGGCCLWEP